MQDDRNLVDGGTAQLVPQGLGDHNGGEPLVGVTGLDPAPSHQAGSEDHRVRGVNPLEGHVTDHLRDPGQRIAAVATRRPGLADLDDLAAADGGTRPVANVGSRGQGRHGLADRIGVVEGLRAGYIPSTRSARGLGGVPSVLPPALAILTRGGVVGRQAQGDGSPLVEFGQLARGLQDKVTQSDDDRHRGHRGHDPDEGEDHAGLLHLDLAPRLDERAQKLSRSVHSVPLPSAGGAGGGASTPSFPSGSAVEGPASARPRRAAASDTSCRVPS